ncbi:CHAT domain-containing protein [Corallococcus exiguus]|uniref:CHAT domain-containing protein n=1 Tax=Corallococcus exiguus TaxID=83462 RepID=UPI0020161894|nr:CHAT domain-containing protein [Corallococcus exiguus]
MSKPCDQLPLFADGGLPLAESQAFGRHLADCAHCQTELTRHLQLDQMGRRYLERHGPITIPWHAMPRNRWLAAGAALVAVALGVLLGVGGVGRRVSSPEPSLWAGTTRALEARVTYPEADKYRRPAQTLMGGGTPSTTTADRPLTVMSELDRRGDLSQLVAAYLSARPPEPDNAKDLLKRMQAERQGEPADLLSDLGAAFYASAKKTQGSASALLELREALRLLHQALLLKPTHLQAHWNRALVYRDLGLPLLAIQDLEAVEGQETHPGWRAEAREKRLKLADVTTRRQRWEAANSAGAELVARGAQALDEAMRYSDVPMMRRDFYHAVRSRTSREDVLALLPLAEALDAKAGQQTVLADYLRSVASRDFSRRASLAEAYGRWVMGAVEPSGKESLLRAFLDSNEDDITLGALVMFSPRGPDSEYGEKLITLGNSSQDPWFKVLALQERADRSRQKDRYDLALSDLKQALELCTQEHLVYRCTEVRNDLAYVSGWRFQLQDAERFAREGLTQARLGQWEQERMLLQALGSVARMSADVTLGRAYFGEALLMGGGKGLARDIHENLAHLAITALELDVARDEINQALATGLPLTRHGVAALADIARTHRVSGDVEAVRQGLDSDLPVTEGQRAFVKSLQGRFLLDVDPAQGHALLMDAIEQAARAEAAASGAGWTDITAQHARAYGFTSLIFDDARREDFSAALARFGNELGFDTPGSCVLGLTEDTERQLLVGRGADGQLLKQYIPTRTERMPVDMADVVPPDMVKALRPCGSVDVLARPPLQGRSGLLPADMAWRYRALAAARQPPVGRGTHLVVNEVRYAEQRNESPLRWTARITPDEDLVTLTDLAATPSRVLAEMPKASEIDLATHGKVAPGPKSTYLLLAPETNGSDMLTEELIRKMKLLKAPLVILAACDAARGTTALHELGSLPNAFLAAGARGVVAATLPIPDEDSSVFFGNVRDRLRAGSPLGTAVRDERQQWLQRSASNNWVNGVLVFE